MRTNCSKPRLFFLPDDILFRNILIYSFILLNLFWNIQCKPAKESQSTQTKTGNQNSDYTGNNSNSESTDYLYRASNRQINDLVHTRLEIEFNWLERKVIGKANITLKPHFYPVDSLTLDAKGFRIKSLKIIKAKNLIPLRFQYDSLQIKIKLDRKYNKNETYTIVIDYIAMPYSLSIRNESFLIDDRGMYFINSDNSTSFKPQQIWTQGQTESNSCWFPTIDSPNQRMTQEIYITVPNKFKTLSNGELVTSLLNMDTTRTDYWKLDKPHAPYLCMIAVGEFAIVKDVWRNIPLQYYVEPEFEPYAKAIFGQTPKMIELFTQLFGIEYPWNKYAQIAVRDYVSGAMENTTATLFGEYVQKNNLQLVDGNDEGVIAHELSHQWFGDLVTCESWSNLSLNEGFATYAEYLWDENRYGKDEADRYLNSIQTTYIDESQQNIKPIIRFNYKFRDDMFDSHSYNKGAIVLHMLRNYIGDEAFFEGIRIYLTENQNSSVEIHNLRLAFEKVSGEDLNWFFNQWFLTAGHPVLSLNYNYNHSDKLLTLTIEQRQDVSNSTIFRLPLKVDFYTEDSIIHKKILFNKPTQTFSFSFPKRPLLVNVDPDKVLLCEKRDHKSIEDYKVQFYRAPLFLDKLEALMAFTENPQHKESKKMLQEALRNKFWYIRYFALLNYDYQHWQEDDRFINLLKLLIQKEPNSTVRNLALIKLGQTDSANYKGMLKEIARKDSSENILEQVINLSKSFSPDLTMSVMEELAKRNLKLDRVTQFFKYQAPESKIDFFENTCQKLTGKEQIYALENMCDFVLRFNDDMILRGAKFYKNIALQNNNKWITNSSIMCIQKIEEHYKDLRIKEENKLKQSGFSTKDVGSTKKNIENYRNNEAFMQKIIKEIENTVK